MKKYFEKDDNYWIIIHSGKELSIIFGKTEGPGLVNIKKYRSPNDVELEYQIQIEKKTQGYKETEKKINLDEMELHEEISEKIIPSFG